MGKTGFGLAAALMLALAGTAAQAQTYDVYDCQFVPSGSGGDQIRMVFATDASGKTFNIRGGGGSSPAVWLPVTVKRLNSGENLYGFSFDTAFDTTTVKIDAKVRIPQAGGASRITLSGRGYGGNPTARGPCAFKPKVRLTR